MPKSIEHTSESACYLYESQLIDELCQEFPIRCNRSMREFDYRSGRADVIALSTDNYLHAFEGKLSKWREALDQARRNGCFAHFLYVVLPHRTSKAAIQNRKEFETLGVGLIVCGNGRPRVEISPSRNEPLLPWLTEVAKRRLEE